ncbi:hypothetical protein AC739_07120 [Planococcus glaciei]|uniref:hypothetical protein n=1 Tax=Planococcus glaciei TaxID=459472 RepID=UPI00069CCE91|nr:hypothetical protein [Planococcus glaciei]KOF11148.1 hypothetical protein AC739_07120 [Planococcus glaciei]
MDTILYFAFTAAYILLLVWAIAKQKSWNFMSFICLVLIGLIYDNGLIAIGKFIGEGPVLENLSLLRFWSHAFLTPMLVLFSWGALNRAGIGWVKKKAVLAAAIIYALALAAIEITLETWGLELATEEQYGVLRYVSAEPSSGPPIMVLLVSVFLIAAGILLWKKVGWKWMLIGAGVMTIGSAVPIPVDSSAATNAFELFLLTTLVWTKVHLESKEQN